MNYHFFIDEKFVNDFVADADYILRGQRYIITCEGTPIHAKHHMLEQMPFNSNELNDVFKIIKEGDAIYVHWFSINLAEYIMKLNIKVKIYLIFMGGDLLQSNFPQPNSLSLDSELFTESSTKEVKKIYNRKLIESCRITLRKARLSKNWKNILHTYINIVWYIVNYKSGSLFREEYKIRKDFLNRITAVCHWNRFDIEFIEKFYDVKLINLFFIYGLGLGKECNKTSEENNPIEAIKIWLGNSDTVTNNHLDALNSLKKFKNENIEIICPLNYGNKNYGDTVEEYGVNIFGSKFIAIRDFIEREEYYKLMNQTSIVIMNHKRGQAGGNIIAFMLKKKKVFLNSQSSIYKLFQSMGITICDANQISKLNFEEFARPLSNMVLEKNQIKIEETLNNDQLRIKSLKIILENSN
jgi:dTDP-N-acetylfucosamine:lipid II N-acetylfucosaminyltransferase